MAKSINAHMGRYAERPMPAPTPLHPSTTPAQVAGRGHPVAGVAPAAPLRADNNAGKATRMPDVTFGAHGPSYSMPGDMSVGSQYNPAIGDKVLDEARMSNRLPGERHHSTCGPKGC